MEIIDIDAGKSHAAAIVQFKEAKSVYNAIYIWGSNKYGQLGLWDLENRSSPTLIQSDEFHQAEVMACGDSFTLVYTSNYEYFSSGSNLQGQLGQGQSINKLNGFSQINGLP